PFLPWATTSTSSSDLSRKASSSRASCSSSTMRVERGMFHQSIKYCRKHRSEGSLPSQGIEVRQGQPLKNDRNNRAPSPTVRDFKKLGRFNGQCHAHAATHAQRCQAFVRFAAQH